MPVTTDQTSIAFGRALRSLRLRLALTQEAFAQRCDSHRNYVGALERGETSPTLRVQLRLARGLGISLVELAGEVERQLAALESRGDDER